LTVSFVAPLLGISTGRELLPCSPMDDIEPRRDASTEEGARIVLAILDACARLLERDGYDAFNTNTIARVAGVSVGSLYQYFPGKKAIVTALAREVEARGHQLAQAGAGPLTDARAATASFDGGERVSCAPACALERSATMEKQIERSVRCMGASLF
jgi:AcrR family transcriptional regulator